MRPVLSRDEMRAFDAHFIRSGVPGVVLMENAGRGAAHLIGLFGKPRRAQGEKKPAGSVGGSCVRCADEAALEGFRVVVLAGPGNNGGDGFVVARHLRARAAEVEVLALGAPPRSTGDAALALETWRAVGGEVTPLNEESLEQALGRPAVIVDALLGTGLTRDVDAGLAALIARVNQSGQPVIALDVPSGLDADTGAVRGAAIVAERTVTFAHLKRGLLTSAGAEHAGRITVSHIGVPSALPPGIEPVAWLLEEGDLRARVRPRSVSTHKAKAGHAVVLGGHAGTVGAVRLAAHGAFRAGAGLVTIASTEETVARLEHETREVMTRVVRPDEPSSFEWWAGAQSLIVGPGFGRGEAARALRDRALRAGKPVVLDAEGLRDVPGGLEALAVCPSLVITPHPGEAAELLGVSVGELEGDRFAAAEELARRSGAIVVLKGSRTLVAAPGQVPWVSAFGSPALATAGSGDVLAGVLGGLLAERQEGAWTRERIFDRVLLAVGLQGLASELWSSKNGDAGLLASEIADRVPEVRARLLVREE